MSVILTLNLTSTCKKKIGQLKVLSTSDLCHCTRRNGVWYLKFGGSLYLVMHCLRLKQRENHASSQQVTDTDGDMNSQLDVISSENLNLPYNWTQQICIHAKCLQTPCCRRSKRKKDNSRKSNSPAGLPWWIWSSASCLLACPYRVQTCLLRLSEKRDSFPEFFAHCGRTCCEFELLWQILWAKYVLLFFGGSITQTSIYVRIIGFDNRV